MIALAGCVTNRTTPAVIDIDEWPPPTQSDSLRFWTWQQYWGAQARAFKHKADLEEVTHQTISSREQAASLDDHQPDVVHLRSRHFGAARDAGNLQPLPTDLMPSWPPQESFRVSALEYYSKDGEYVGIPQTPVAISMAYHSEKVEAPSSWERLWDEALKGQIAMPRDPILLGQIGALYTGQDPHSPSDFGRIRTALETQQSLVGMYWSDWQSAWHRFGLGDLTVGVLPQPRLCLCSQDGSPIRYAVPREGVLYGYSTLAIPETARNPHVGLKFIDWAADFKTGTETMWNADEWQLYHARPVDEETWSRFEQLGNRLRISEE